MALPDPNNLSPDLRAKLAGFKWSQNSFLDLHKLGVHYFHPSYLPTWLDPYTYSALLHRGLTPPMALPIKNPAGTQDRIKQFLDFNYFKMSDAALQYLGNEFNIQREEEWDKAKVRVCLARLSDYKTLDGAFGGFLVNNFIQDYADDIFVDFSWFPAPEDISKLYANELPLMWGNITKRPLTDFDIVIIATSYPGERVNLPVALVKSGIPLYNWQRFDESLPYYKETPIVALAGIGASFIENMLGDNPVKGIAGNAAADHILIGEGELMDLKYIQQYLNTVILDGGTKKDFMKAITNEHHLGCYDPTKFLFEYADKIHELKDHTGKVLDKKVYEAGGHIKAIHLVDHDAKIKYAMAGPASEEFQELEPVNAQYHLKMVGNLDPAELGRRYVKISDRPSVAQRKLAGMAPQDASTQQQVAEERKAGITRVQKPQSGAAAERDENLAADLPVSS